MPQASQGAVAKLSELDRHSLAGDFTNTAEVCTGSKDEFFTGNCNTVDFSLCGTIAECNECFVELEKTLRSQGVGAFVVESVIQGDQCQDLATGQRNVPNEAVSDDFFLAESEEICEINGVVISHYLAPL